MLAIRELILKIKSPGIVRGFLLLVRPAGRICLKMNLRGAGKFFTHPTGGSVSWTARVPVARQDLKEAASKALA